MIQRITITDNENNKWKRKAKNKDGNAESSYVSYNESVRAKWFCYVFNLDFLQLMCKDSLILKWNLELALSIILKNREL